MYQKKYISNGLDEPKYGNSLLFAPGTYAMCRSSPSLPYYLTKSYGSRMKLADLGMLISTYPFRVSQKSYESNGLDEAKYGNRYCSLAELIDFSHYWQ